MFCAGAFLCSLYFLFCFLWEEKKKWIKLIVLIPATIAPLFLMYEISSRSTFIGVFSALVGAFVFIHRKMNKKAVIIRGSVALLTVVLSVLGLVGFSAVLNYVVVLEGFDFSSPKGYFLFRLYQLLNEGSKKGYFGDAYILNILDHVSSLRLRIWAESLKQIEWVGHPFRIIVFQRLEGRLVTPGIFPDVIESPHNFFIFSLIRYGLVGGMLVIAWFVIYIIISAKKSIECDKSVILSTLWIFFCIANFMFSCETWASPVYFGLLLLQYPLIRHIREKESKQL